MSSWTETSITEKELRKFCSKNNFRIEPIYEDIYLADGTITKEKELRWFVIQKKHWLFWITEIDVNFRDKKVSFWISSDSKMRFVQDLIKIIQENRVDNK